MYNLKTWCRDKPDLVSVFAKTLLIELEELSQTLSHLRQKGETETPYLIPLNKWILFYRNHRHIRNYFLSLLPNGVETLNQKQNEPKKLLEQFNTHLGNPGEGLKLVEELIGGLIDSDNPEDEARLTDFNSCREFLFRVQIPCWFAWNTTPAQLLRKARQGDRSAILDLIQLDKSMVAEPRVAEVWHRLVTDAALHPTAVAAMKKKPPAVSVGKLKASVGAVLWLAAEASGYKMTTTELRNAFDAVARDKFGQPIDTDIPDDDAAFYQAVIRQRKATIEMIGLSPKQWRITVQALQAHNVL